MIVALGRALLALLSPVTADKWEDYPVCTRPILDKYAPPDLGEFKACGCNDYEEATANLIYNCEKTKTPAAYDYTTIIILKSNQTEGCVDSPTTTSNSPSPTSTSTSTSTKTPDPPHGRWDAGVIVGVVFGGIDAFAAVGLLVFDMVVRLKRKPKQAPSRIVYNYIQNNFALGNAVNAAGRGGGRRPARLLQV